MSRRLTPVERAARQIQSEVDALDEEFRRLNQTPFPREIFEIYMKSLYLPTIRDYALLVSLFLDCDSCIERIYEDKQNLDNTLDVRRPPLTQKRKDTADRKYQEEHHVEKRWIPGIGSSGGYEEGLDHGPEYDRVEPVELDERIDKLKIHYLKYAHRYFDTRLKDMTNWKRRIQIRRMHLRDEESDPA